MTKILVLYYSSFGHIETLAHSIGEGARSVGAEVHIKRVPETATADVVSEHKYKTDFTDPIADPNELPNYDGIVFGSPTRFGGMCTQMRSFLDMTGGLWYKGLLAGKVGSFFTSSNAQHGGQEATILSSLPYLFHQGMVIIGVPSYDKGWLSMDGISGGTPYGASSVGGSNSSKPVSKNEMAIAFNQGKHVAETAMRQCIPIQTAASISNKPKHSENDEVLADDDMPPDVQPSLVCGYTRRVA